MAEKRFPPSLQRLQRARREGKVVKSRMVGAFLSAATLLGLLLTTRPWVRIGTLIHWLNIKVLPPEQGCVHALLVAGLVSVVLVGSIALVTGCVGLAQTRGIFVIKQILPDISRVSPGRYVARARDGAVEVVAGFARVCLLMLVMGGPLWAYVLNTAGALSFAHEHTSDLIRAALFSVSLRGVATLGVFAGLSYVWARWRFMKSHRMSYEEVQKEHKESEGDPHFRAARRHEHQVLSMAEIERRVRNSKVLIVRRRPV